MSDFQILPIVPNESQAKIIIQEFGLSALKTNLYKAGMPASNGVGKSYGTSSLGTSVFSNLDITGFNYIDNNGSTISVPSINFDTVLFTVTQNKNFVITNLQGRNSSVKEYISDNDYSVDIIGVLNAPNRNFPLQDLQNLISLLKAPVSFKVNSWYLGLFGITNLVVNSYNIGQREGMYSNQPFQIQLLSDSPLELQFNQ